MALLRQGLAASNLEIILVDIPLARPAADPGQPAPTGLVLVTNRGQVPFFEIVKLFSHPAYGALRRFLSDLASGGRYLILAREADLTAAIDPELPAEAFAQLEHLPLHVASGQIEYNRQRGEWEASDLPPAWPL